MERVRLTHRIYRTYGGGISCFVVILCLTIQQCTQIKQDPANFGEGVWEAPDTASIPHTSEGDLIRYGRKLISNTAHYLGPNGVVSQISNRTNCENCHIDAGTKPFGNSFAAVNSIYPVFRPRSGRKESIEFRINDCLQRSMNGKMLDSTAYEMRAIVAYLQWIGKDVPKGTVPHGTGTLHLTFLDRPTDTLKGKAIYDGKCRLCHGTNGEGTMKSTADGFLYPPLWGPESYNTGAGMFRISKLAGFVKSNMPFGTKYNDPQLTEEEAWDVAAYINSKPRTVKQFQHDWPDLKKKAIDMPYGPYFDHFSEAQHKWGPFGPIKSFMDSVHASTKAK